MSAQGNEDIKRGSWEGFNSDQGILIDMFSKGIGTPSQRRVLYLGESGFFGEFLFLVFFAFVKSRRAEVTGKFLGMFGFVLKLSILRILTS
jgi:hypothetical protein